MAVRSAQRIEALGDALASRTDIGIALGTVRERRKLTQPVACESLARVALSREVKLRNVATQIVETRHVPTWTPCPSEA